MSNAHQLDPYKAQKALRRFDQNLTRALVEARGIAAIEGAEYAQGHGDLETLQDWRSAEGVVTGLAQAAELLRDAITAAVGSCRWCGGPDDHGQDCRPAPHGTQRTPWKIP